MQAAVVQVYGHPKTVVSIKEVAKPVPSPDQVLVRVKATSLNASDNEFITGSPGYIRLFNGVFAPRVPCLGSDIAGVVESCGSRVDQKLVQPGDAIVGDSFGSFG
ncbi:hypothetical protein HDU91_002852, partial [Kappamyces sp. JEL0680]